MSERTPTKERSVTQDEETQNYSKTMGGISYQCQLEGHDEQPLNMICINDDCPEKGLICANCLTNEHYDHLKYCLSLKVFLNASKSSMATTNDFKKQEDQMQSINDKFEEIFYELKVARDEFEDCFNRLDATFRFFSTRLNEHMQQYNLEHLKTLANRLEERSFKSVPELDHSVDLLIEHAAYSDEHPKHFQIMPVREKILLLRKKYRDLSSGLLQLKKFLDPIVLSMHKAPVFQEFAEEFHDLNLDSFRSDLDHAISEEEVEADGSAEGSQDEEADTEAGVKTLKSPDDMTPLQIAKTHSGDGTERNTLLSTYRDIAESIFKLKKPKRARKSQLETEFESKRMRPTTFSLDFRESKTKANLVGIDTEKQLNGMDALEEVSEKINANEMKHDGDFTREDDVQISMKLRQQRMAEFNPRNLACEMSIQERSSSQVNTLVILHDKKTILTGNNRGQVNAWDYNEGKLIKTVVTLDSQICGLLGIHVLERERFAVACTSGELYIYDYYTDQYLYTLKETKGCITGLVYFEDFTTIASAGKEAVIAFWDVNSGQEIAKIEKAHDEWIWSLVYLKDNESLVSSGADGAIKIWNYKTQELMRVLNELGSFLICSVYIKQPNLLAFGDSSGIIKVLNAETGSIMYNLIGHKGRINSLTYLADGEYLVSASEDKTIRIWGLRNGSHIVKLSEHRSKVSTVVAFEDQISLVSNGWDKTIKFWTTNVK